MTLRTRIAAVAGVSVALAVLAAAVGLYVAVSTDLRGEVDTGLRARVRGLSNRRRMVNRRLVVRVRTVVRKAARKGRAPQGCSGAGRRARAGRGRAAAAREGCRAASSPRRSGAPRGTCSS